MKLIYLFLVCLSITSCSNTKATNQVSSKDFYSLVATTTDKKPISFEQYRNKVVLVSNISLKCGTTQQLKDLEELYQTYKDHGLIVLAFPSNDFTDDGTENPEKIQHICSAKYGVTFPLFMPGLVTGENKQDVFKLLTSCGTDNAQGEIMFNMEKFLIDKKGVLRARYGTFTGAMSSALTRKVEKLLNE